MTRRHVCNKYFLTSAGAIAQMFALGLGGGVIGVLARNELHERHIPEALLWVASFAWVTTFIDFIVSIFEFAALHTEAQLIYGLFVTVAYTVCTIFYGIYETFPVTHSSKGLLVFVLSIGTVTSYAILTVWSGIEIREENAKKNEAAGLEDEQKLDNVFVEDTKVTKAPAKSKSIENFEGLNEESEAPITPRSPISKVPPTPFEGTIA